MVADQALPPGIAQLHHHLAGKEYVGRPTIFPLSQLFELLSNLSLTICISQIKLKLNLPDHSSGAMMKKERLAELLLDHLCTIGK